MANQRTRLLPVEVEFEFSRLASQYLKDAYAQVLPEIRSVTKTPRPDEYKHENMKRAKS